MRYLSWALPIFLVSYLFACTKPVRREVITVWNEKNSPVITNTSLFDTLRVNAIRALDIHELHGVRASYLSGKTVSYFEYDTDPEKLLTFISCLPFKKTDAVSDTVCHLQNFTFSQSGRELLSGEELTSAAFFWKINPDDYLYYECLKSPARHTILINKKTKRVLHRIESVS